MDVGNLENANELPAWPSRNENYAVLSPSTCRSERVFQIRIYGDKLNECVKKEKSTKVITKGNEKEETDFN